MAINFGSDGFRGIIGHGLTCDTLARIILGTAQFVHSKQPEEHGQTIPIGYDTRFMARPFAEYAAQLLSVAGYKPLLSHRACPTPYLSFATNKLKAPVGIQITASHNPHYYLGVKLKSTSGGSLVPGDVQMIEFYANNIDESDIHNAPFCPTGHDAETFNVEDAYEKAVLKAAGWSGSTELKLIVDFMHGSARGIYHDLLNKLFKLNTSLRMENDPLFGGAKPEPTKAALKELSHRVTYDGHQSVGLAFDGDGDRLAVVDENGRFLATHEIFCLLLEHLADNRGQKGIVVKTVSFSGLIERVAEAHGCQTLEVPVGFKSISEAMGTNGAIIGGEESGGTGFGCYLPERDALLMAMMLLHAREISGITISEMVESIYERYGRPVFIRRDIPLTNDIDTDDLRNRVRSLADISNLIGEEVIQLNHKDGMKLKTAGSWVLARPSGTEPLVRIYAESDTEEHSQALIDTVVKHLGLDSSG